MKGSLFGVVCFALFSGFYFWAQFGRAIQADKAIGLGVIKAAVIANPFYWSIGALMILTGYLIQRTWPTF
jgi:hypothetical protein